MPGPKPVPTPLLRARGSRLAKGRESLEVGVEVGEPDMPDSLDDEARVYWRRYADILIIRGVLSTGDGAALATFCRNLSRIDKCEDLIAQHGLMVPTAGGSLKTNPAVQVLAAAEDKVAKMMALLGLSPADRSKAAKAQKPKGANRFADF